MLIYCCCSVTKLCPTQWPQGLQRVSFTISWSLLKFTFIDSVVLSNHLILCCPLLLLPSISPKHQEMLSNESALHIKTQMVGKIEGRRRRGQQRMRWLDDIISSMDMNWANSRKQWGTGRPGMLQSIELHTTLWTRRVGYNLAAEQQKHSAYKLNKQGDNIQPCRTPFPILKQSVVPCKVLTVTFRPTYRFLRRQVRWS